ncbi:alpha/beta-Hydrolases superfamily protein [Trifolium repens]|nr:alpha/beta-Hydrolases superfamily protein [Trifolium repens]
MATEAFILKESAYFSLRALKSLLVLISAMFMVLLLPFRGRRRVSPVEKEDKIQNHECCHHHHHRKGAVVRVPAKIVPWKSAGGGSGVGVVAMKVMDHIMRRELAIRRVLEDGDEKCMREYWLFGTKRGDTIFTQCWTPLYAKIRGLVIVMHGLNEHSGRYSNFAKQLNANGYKVYGMDWIGHGGSDGLHGYVHSLDDAVSDLKVFIEKVISENPGLPLFCYAHSTGAAITLKALLDPKVGACVAGATFTSPAVGVEPSHPILVALAPILSFLLPTFQCNSAYKKGLPVSRDPEALIAKYSDPLVCTGPLRVRTGYEILQITSYLQQNLRKMRVPFLVLHGTADSVTDPTASQKLYEESSSSDKSIKLYEGFSHDLLFEPEREAITEDIIQWLNSRV